MRGSGESAFFTVSISETWPLLPIAPLPTLLAASQPYSVLGLASYASRKATSDYIGRRLRSSHTAMSVHAVKGEHAHLAWDNRRVALPLCPSPCVCA